jgi:Tol biopolymer transport system component
LTHSAGTRKHNDFDYSQDPSWSPDGTRIAFDGQRDNSAGNGNQVFVIRVDGSGERQITSASTPEWFPAWSPDGKILFEHPLGRWSAPDPQGIQQFRDNGRIDLFIVNANGGGRQRIARLRTELGHCACAAWSADGTMIAYEAAEAGGKPDIWTMNADGTGRVQLTHHPARDENPDWSPDGTQIAFYSERTGNAQIYVVNADGTEEHRVTHDPWYDQAVRWRPAS